MTYSGNILTQGTETFAPVMTQLSNILTEFVPYIVYIGLGVLVFSLVISAVKWIVSYFSGKAVGSIRRQ